MICIEPIDLIYYLSSSIVQYIHQDLLEQVGLWSEREVPTANEAEEAEGKEGKEWGDQNDNGKRQSRDDDNGQKNKSKRKKA